jgi:hypothetical protein
MLRQGRGDGYRAALTGHAVDDVLACVLDDPRWDRQVEARDEYYAALLIRLDADVSVIRDMLTSDQEREESDVWLPIGVLSQMARRGHLQASQALNAAVRGRWGRACLDALGSIGEDLVGRVLTPAAVSAFAGNADPGDLADAVAHVAAPWRAWAVEVTAVRFVLETAGIREARPMSGPVGWIAPALRIQEQQRKIDPALTNAAIFALAKSDTRLRVAALRVLGERGCIDYVGEAETFLSAQAATQRNAESNAWRSGYLRYLEALPSAVTLERGRAWFTQPWPLGLAGRQILARHATLDDRLMLEDVGAAALTADDMYRLCSCVDGLGSIGSEESLPFLFTIYSEAPYSYARRGVVRALTAHSDDVAARDRLLEALWDCEGGSRLIAIKTLRAADASEQLQSLVTDPFEEEDVRVAARAALTRSETP